MVVFTDFDTSEELPLNQATDVVISPQRAGGISFHLPDANVSRDISGYAPKLTVTTQAYDMVENNPSMTEISGEVAAVDLESHHTEKITPLHITIPVPTQAESSLRTISAPALKAFSFPLATSRDKGAIPQLVHG